MVRMPNYKSVGIGSNLGQSVTSQPSCSSFLFRMVYKLVPEETWRRQTVVTRVLQWPHPGVVMTHHRLKGQSDEDDCDHAQLSICWQLYTLAGHFSLLG